MAYSSVDPFAVQLLVSQCFSAVDSFNDWGGGGYHVVEPFAVEAAILSLLLRSTL